MAQLSLQDVADFVAMTQRRFPFDKWTDLGLPLQNYKLYTDFIPAIKKTVGDPGEQTSFQMKVSMGGTAEMVGPYEKATVNAKNMMVRGTVPYRFMRSHALFDRKIAMMQKGRKIVDLMLIGRSDGKQQSVIKAEEEGWGVPAVGDSMNAYGIRAWVTKYNALNPGTTFYGTNHVNFSSGVGGVSRVTYPNAKNWASSYTVVDDTTEPSASAAGLFKQMRYASYYTNFVAPIPVPGQPESGPLRIYSNLTTVVKAEDVLRGANDQNGSDLAFYLGRAIFNRVPIQPVRYLDTDTNNPVYMLDMGGWEMPCPDGEFITETEPIKGGVEWPDLVAVYWNSAFNFVLSDPRSQAVICESGTTDENGTALPGA